MALGGLLGLDTLLYYLVRAAVMLIAIPFHESAHALASHLLGDDTAKNAGRLSLDPRRHFDPLGAICMILGGIGWARPVGIDARRFQNPKAGMALSAAAGPLSNLLLAFLGMVLFKGAVYGLGLASGIVYLFLYYLVSMNISLAVFNLIPVPPFDGSRIALLFLPQRWYFRLMNYERYIMLGVFLLVLTGLLNAPLGFAVDAVWRALDRLTGFMDAILLPRWLGTAV